ncbi:Metallo-beta-lactamase superfamily protein [Tissierella praeacuta DSM 18095]|uniref:Metallo-beta-lactamase superfamily protein n=1 Tax=Tissierella praeacuta DSM 18095 TaxID=1123404 RepID=A0A1M4X8G8_9FIRM|nr:MBL fold metallo-hydrolase [Tissierella praeacuta]SHE89774.1 Metallo-beta-lactamase superfamily protein [Tissierella praeacuta DSM 18095]SUP02509.1 Predicted metal-dependent RNase, consists of a metallo-beta-lactamase domain and an RNA-binding KH domain [Tissierella praeacuta]
MKIMGFNAKNGDSTYIRSNGGTNIIVDMGYSDTYKEYISNKIIEIEKAGENLDLLVITHIDHDHISGAITFLKDIHNGRYRKSTLKQIWHNSYRHLSMSTRAKASDEDYNIINTFLSRLSKHNSLITGAEISALQGSTLAGLILKSGVEWNKNFSYSPIIEGAEAVIGDVIIKALSPSEYILNKLKRYWRSELRKLKYNFEFAENEIFDDAFEFYLLNETEVDGSTPISVDIRDRFNALLDKGHMVESQNDTSVSNASSIVTIIESKNCRILLTGDAHDCDLVEVLTEQKQNGLNTDFDLVKLSHHGSKKNNYKWLQLVRSKYYLISTDASKHNHPDIEAIINIILSSPLDKKILCFNNDLEIISKINDDKLKKKYNYSIMRPNRDWGIEIEL